MKHPEICYSNDINNNCIIIKWGESGYYPTNYPEGKYNDEVINELNARGGISPEMRKAMEFCSIVAQEKSNLDWEKHYKKCINMLSKR